MASIDIFNPTEIWTPGSADFHLEESIETARRRINEENPRQLIHGLKESVERSDEGIVYAVLKGKHPEEYSDTDALVMFNPFANTATANMLVRAEFIRQVAEQASVRDEQGKLKPVIMLSSPGIFGSRLGLDKDDKKAIRHGSLGPAAERLLAAVAGRDYGRVALLGFSQGADLAVAGVKDANRANLDVDSLSVGDPAGVMERKKAELALDFLESGSKFQQAIEASDIEAQKQAIGKGPLSPVRLGDFIRFGAVGLTPTNRAIWSALGRDTFEANMQELLDDGTIDRAVVGYGGASSIAQPAFIEPSLAKLHADVADNRLISIRVEGADHSWGDNLPLLAKLYLRALV